MQVHWRPNPKTPDGWPKRAAIALLVGFGTFVLSSPVAFFFFLSHFESLSPKDMLNLLRALTASVVLGVVLAGLSTFATLSVSLLLKYIRSSAARPV